MFRKKETKETRFYEKSSEQLATIGRVSVLVDRVTGVHYLHTWVGSGSGLTPLLDENGEVVVEKIEK
ncbi:DUF6440 family protein [Alkalicoccobacillus murimartini]|uniref:DUF6440 domain-containing protein n=1 Tax=Alkalicoccobacillus murimartini TaxID=171685 RepID=A0ABT9YGL8_9BACI|nr:DUF6440 family protein [Alkalicoccobacillus murimartini]MDQ0206975.1 hypothetical protein [Alkalicoccobacillus murimartini]